MTRIYYARGSDTCQHLLLYFNIIDRAYQKVPPPIGVIGTITKLLTRAFQWYMTHDNQTKFLSLKVDLRRKNSLVFSFFKKKTESPMVMIDIPLESNLKEVYRYAF